MNYIIIFIELFHILLHILNFSCIYALPTSYHKLYFSLDAFSGYYSLVYVKKSNLLYKLLLYIHLWIHTHTILYLFNIKDDTILDSVFEQQLCNTSYTFIYEFGTLMVILFHICNIIINIG